MVTTFENATEVVTQEIVDKWKRTRRPEVTNAIMNMVTSKLYDLVPEVITDLLYRSSNPFVGLIPSDNVLDFARSQWSMVYFFDLMTEIIGIPPTWDEYWEAMNTQYSSFWINRISSTIHTSEQVSRAIKWKMAKAWSAWIRELYVLTSIREMGYNIQKHTFADIEGRIDMWYKGDSGIRAICLTVANKYDINKKEPVVPFKKFYLPNNNFGTLEWFPSKKQIEEIEIWINE